MSVQTLTYSHALYGTFKLDTFCTIVTK